MREITAPVFVVATLDTKAEEATFIAERLREDGVAAAIVDVGVFNAPRAAPHQEEPTA